MSLESLPEKMLKKKKVQVIFECRHHNDAFRGVDGVTTASGCQDVTGFLQFARLSRDQCYQINPAEGIWCNICTQLSAVVVQTELFGYKYIYWVFGSATLMRRFAV